MNVVEKHHLQRFPTQPLNGLINQPATSKLSSFTHFDLPSISSFNYSYVTFSKEKGINEIDDKFKHSAFEHFQKHSNVKRYNGDGDLYFASRPHNNSPDNQSSFAKYIESKDKALLREVIHKTISHINFKRLNHKSDLHKSTHSNHSSSGLVVNINKNQMLNRKYDHISDINQSTNFLRDTYRIKRELNKSELNGSRHNNTTIKSNKHTKLTHLKKKRSRKHRRMYFDEKESPKNITILNGQTALLTCTVRNVGNQTVSLYSVNSSIYISMQLYIYIFRFS